MTPEQQKFMGRLNSFGGHATVAQLGPQTTQAENAARQFCKSHGWVTYDRPCWCWRMTDKGRAAFRATIELTT